MSIQLTEFAHLVSSSRDMHKDQVSIDTTQASLIVNDIVENNTTKAITNAIILWENCFISICKGIKF